MTFLHNSKQRAPCRMLLTENYETSNRIMKSRPLAEKINCFIILCETETRAQRANEPELRLLQPFVLVLGLFSAQAQAKYSEDSHTNESPSPPSHQPSSSPSR